MRFSINLFLSGSARNLMRNAWKIGRAGTPGVRGKLKSIRAVILGVIMTLGAGMVNAEEEVVRLQLKWLHQFQFAGYYAAEMKGYYAEAGLKVEMMEGQPQQNPVRMVLDGVADFGVSDTDVLLHRLRGEPVVVCAAVFQHSPYIILTRADRGIRTPHDLKDARMMLSDGQGIFQFQAMLAQEGVDPKLLDVVPHSWNLDDLIEGRVDAQSAYSTVEPGRMRARGVEPYFIRALDYGVDFYGDTLFTTEEHARLRRDQTKAFVDASMQGWKYAMENVAEVAGYILTLPGVAERGLTLELLMEEAEVMRGLVLPDVVEIGHMNEGRWERIAETYARQGLLKGELSLEGFLLQGDMRTDLRWLRILVALIGVGLVALGMIVAWNLQIRRGVNTRTRELREEISRREDSERESMLHAQRLKMAQHVGAIGDWTYDLESGKIDWSESLFHLFGRAESEGEPAFDELLSVYDSGDAERLRENVDKAMREGEGYTMDCRLKTAEGIRWHYCVGEAERDASGAVVRLHGIAQDITPRKEAAERLRIHLQELERWRDVTLGREERIQDLKREVNDLLGELGRPGRYSKPGEDIKSGGRI